MHALSLLTALFVTFLWSTSFVIIKLGLQDLPALSFAGLRYALGFLCFFPFIWRKHLLNQIQNLTRKQWFQLSLLGLVFYAMTQGAQFLGLSMLPSVTVSLMLNFTPIVVAIMGIFLIGETLRKLQWLGSSFFLLGIWIYFFPIKLSPDQWVGVSVMAFGVLANASSAILGRSINRNKNLSPLVVTFVSMGIGASMLVGVSLFTNGVPHIEWKSWGYLMWLAGFNTAFAFYLWNWTLRGLTAIESSIINGTMLIQIALLAWIFLGETISIREGFGMAMAALGALLVQLKFKKKTDSSS